MKIPVIIACFMPWIFYALWKLVLPYEVPMLDLSLTWMIASPLVIAAVILIAYRKGQISKGTV